MLELNIMLQLYQIKSNLKMMESVEVQYLSEYLVCLNEECNIPLSIYHKKSFKSAHSDLKNSKHVAHESVPFDQSPQFFNFLKLVKVEKLLRRKIQKSLGCFITDTQNLVRSALFNSELMKQVFGESVNAKNQYFYLRYVQDGIKANLPIALSEDFCLALTYFSDSKVFKIYKSLCSDSREWLHLINQFNYISGNNPNYLQSFIQYQRGCFVAYCQSLIQSKKDFQIKDYIHERYTNKGYTNDPTYFTRQFTSFLVDKYQTNSAEQDLFHSMEYFLHFWKYFKIFAHKDKTSNQYILECIQTYKEYQKYAKQNQIEESLLDFQIWRMNNRKPKLHPTNFYLVELFAISFIQSIIEKKNFHPEEKFNYDWSAFASYLNDYINYVQNKKQIFDFNRYGQYADFRKKHEKFQSNLQKNKQITFNKKLFIQYAHQQFHQNSKLAIKKYKKFIQKDREEELKKRQQQLVQISNLRVILEEKEKQRFYQTVYLNYISFCRETKQSISEESYFQFKKNVFEKIDEDYIRQEDLKYQKSLMEEKEETKVTEKKEEEKIQEIEELDQVEEKVMEDLQGQSSSSEDDFQNVREICPCCKGSPYDCRAVECKAVGYCISCMY